MNFIIDAQLPFVLSKHLKNACRFEEVELAETKRETF